MNIIPGGPEPPDLSNYPKSERDAVLAAYLVKRKAFTDRDCHRRHNMADCFQNPANQLITLEEGSTLEEGMDKFGEDCQEGKA